MRLDFVHNVPPKNPISRYSIRNSTTIARINSKYNTNINYYKT
jgi:hypothetical protein